MLNVFRNKQQQCFGNFTCSAANVSLRFYKKYGTPVLGPLIWLFSSVSVKNFTSLSYEMTQKMNTDEQHEFHKQKTKGTDGDD
jgi:hypothetical protein